MDDRRQARHMKTSRLLWVGNGFFLAGISDTSPDPVSPVFGVSSLHVPAPHCLHTFTDSGVTRMQLYSIVGKMCAKVLLGNASPSLLPLPLPLLDQAQASFTRPCDAGEIVGAGCT